MSLTLPVEELCRFVVLANISDRDGRVALTLKPSLSKDPSPQTSSGLSIHFETVEADGGYVLSVFTSSRPPVTSTTPYPTPEEGNTPEPVPSTSNQQMDSNSIRLSPMNDDLGMPLFFFFTYTLTRCQKELNSMLGFQAGLILSFRSSTTKPLHLKTELSYKT